jgi:hypothetical protein
MVLSVVPPTFRARRLGPSSRKAGPPAHRAADDSPEVRPAYVPMEVLGLQVEREGVRQDRVPSPADVLGGWQVSDPWACSPRRLLPMPEVLGLSCIRSVHWLRSLIVGRLTHHPIILLVHFAGHIRSARRSHQ